MMFRPYRPAGSAVQATPDTVDLRPLAFNPDGTPATVLMVTARHTQRPLSPTMPTWERIESILKTTNFGSESPGALPLPASLRDLPSIPSAWIGPTPRVVRRTPGLGLNKETDVAWILRLTPPANATPEMIGAAQQNRKRIIERRLVEITGDPSEWSGANLTTYAPALHGPLEWWHSGYSARTATRNHYPAITDVDLQENPIGPTTEDLQSPDYLTWLSNFGGGGSLGGLSWGLLLGGVATLGGVVYIVSRTRPRAAVTHSREAPPRANPARRRR